MEKIYYRRPEDACPGESKQPPKGPRADKQGRIIINRQIEAKVVQYEFGAERYTMLCECKNRFGNDIPTFQGKSVWPVGEYRVKWSPRLDANYVLPFRPRVNGVQGRAEQEHNDPE